MKIEIRAIHIADRVRKDTGDLSPLMESMQTHGQLNPITVTRKNELIAGQRRFLSAQKLGWEYIDATVVDRDSEIEKLEIELEENVHRKDFSPEELLEGYRRLDKLRSPSLLKRVCNFFKGIFARLLKRKPRQAQDSDIAREATRHAAPGTPENFKVEETPPGQYGI